MAERNSRGVSPVVGTVALLALTIVMAATTAAFVMDIHPPTEPDLRQSLESDDQPETPNATFQFTQSRGLTTVTHSGGDTLAADRVTLATDDGSQQWADSGEVTEGDSRTVSGSGVRVLWNGEVIGESGT